MIAISYRRDDSLPIAGRLYDRLQAKFGKGNVFMDFDSIPPGTDFREQIKQVIGGAQLVVAVIGPNWLGQQPDSSRRIDNPADFVRLEISYALKRGIPVVPVLINNTEMPPSDKLPQDIEELAFRNAVALDTGIDFHHHADRLITGITKAMNAAAASGESPKMPEPIAPAPAAKRLPFKKVVPLSVAIVLVLAGSAIWFFAQQRREQAKNGGRPTTVVEKPEPAKSEPKVTGAAPVSSSSVGPAATASVATSLNEVTSVASPSQTAQQPARSTSMDGYDPGVAFVDMNRIFKEYTKTKTAEGKINEAKQAAKREYDDRADAYKKALNEINNLNRQLNSATLSASAKTATAKERDDKIAAIKKMEKEINDFRTAREKELQEQALRMREGIVDEITARIQSEARQFKGVVLDKSGNSMNGVAVTMFAPADADMSAKVISGLNDNQPSPFAASHDVSFAVVDMNRIFKTYSKTKDAEAKINSAKEAAKKEYDDRADAYKKGLNEINDLNRQLSSATLNASDKTAKAKERDDKIAAIKNLEKGINDFRTTREKELQQQALRLREGIVKEITDMIGAKLDRTVSAVIIDISGMSLGGAPLAASVRGIPDYSDEVIAALNGSRDEMSGKFKESMVQSQSMRFGVVDLERAFKSWPGTKEAEAEIAESKAAAKKESEHESKDVRDKKEKELQAKALTLRNNIVAKITPALKAVATSKDFNLVFDSSGKSLNGVPVVVLASDLPDLTEDILRK